MEFAHNRPEKNWGYPLYSDGDILPLTNAVDGGRQWSTAVDGVSKNAIGLMKSSNALEIGGHPEAGRSANTNCYWRQRFRGLLRCHLELATYRSASLVTVCGDVCQTPKSFNLFRRPS